MTAGSFALQRISMRRVLGGPYPATILLVGTYVVLAILMRTVLHDSFASIQAYVGWDLDTLKSMHYWRQLPNSLLQSPSGFKWHQILMLTFCVGVLEYRAGSRVMLLTFFVSDFIASFFATLVIWLLASNGSTEATGLLHHPSSGASAATLACCAAVAAGFPGYVAFAATGALVGAVLQSFTYQSLDTSFAHLFATLIGATLGASFSLRQRRSSGRHASNVQNGRGDREA